MGAKGHGYEKERQVSQVMVMGESGGRGRTLNKDKAYLYLYLGRKQHAQCNAMAERQRESAMRWSAAHVRIGERMGRLPFAGISKRGL